MDSIVRSLRWMWRQGERCGLPARWAFTLAPRLFVLPCDFEANKSNENFGQFVLDKWVFMWCSCHLQACSPIMFAIKCARTEWQNYDTKIKCETLAVPLLQCTVIASIFLRFSSKISSRAVNKLHPHGLNRGVCYKYGKYWGEKRSSHPSPANRFQALASH